MKQALFGNGGRIRTVGAVAGLAGWLASPKLLSLSYFPVAGLSNNSVTKVRNLFFFVFLLPLFITSSRLFSPLAVVSFHH
jgi:hypothetical protein